MALGATPVGVIRLVFASTVWEVAIGMLSGVAMSVLLNGVLKKWVAGSSQTPLLVAAAIFVLLATSILAAVIPARRAAAVDPMSALRYD
jgi:putative ABC transport system permease protein